MTRLRRHDDEKAGVYCQHQLCYIIEEESKHVNWLVRKTHCPLDIIWK